MILTTQKQQLAWAFLTVKALQKESKLYVNLFHVQTMLGNILYLKAKAISVTDRGGLQGCEMLRIPHCLDNLLTDGGKVVSFKHRQRSTPQEHYFYLPVRISVTG
jgi:hypothetical protein